MSLGTASRLALLVVALPALALAEPSDGAFRNAAQRGLDFLGQDTARWQQSNNCFGCHVQAVSLEGLSVGLHNQYVVKKPVLDEVLRGMLTMPGGSRTPTGLSHSGFPRTAKTFGAAAFARFDALVADTYTRDLLVLARELLAFQDEAGRVNGDHQGPPVSTGPMQATFQAAQAWRQAYARTADQEWLVPLRQAEKFMDKTARGWSEKPGAVYLQDLNYAVMGLLVAGVSPSEPHLARLIRHLESRQHDDGGWGFDGGSEAFATGQSIATLKLAGRTEDDRSVHRGLSWLVEHQSKDGGWGHGGAGRAEAMWGVLGLVSVDVVSISVSGLSDGQHVDSKVAIQVKATDNSNAEVKQVQVLVDDLQAKRGAGGTLSFDWDTSKLARGKHTVDVVATNAKGRTSRRRFEVFAGDTFLTQLGSRYTAEGTQLTLRNIAPESVKGTIQLEIRGTDAQSQKAVVFKKQQAANPGAMSFVFGGKDASGKAFTTGRYEATFRFVDAAGRERHAETTTFVHDTPEAQRARYAEVEGKLDLARDGSGAANAEVELVDEKGNVVQRVQSNEAGQYRFKGVDAAKYKVRVKKEGFRAEDAMVEAKAGAPAAAASVSLH